MSPRRGTRARPRRSGRRHAGRPLGFYDHHRQRYADKVPLDNAGEFLIGDYNPDGTVTADGEFKVTLIELCLGGHRALHPHLEVFGDGVGSLRRAIDAGLLDALQPLNSPCDLARRLLDMGMADRSDRSLMDQALQSRRR